MYGLALYFSVKINLKTARKVINRQKTGQISMAVTELEIGDDDLRERFVFFCPGIGYDHLLLFSMFRRSAQVPSKRTSLDRSLGRKKYA